MKLVNILTISIFIFLWCSCSGNDKVVDNKPAETEPTEADKQNDESHDFPASFPAADCIVASFIENYHESENIFLEDIFFIKGVALDTIVHGRDIKVIEDLRGNFPSTADTIRVWGMGKNTNRLDRLSIYDNQDTVLMLLMQAQGLSNTPPGNEELLEKQEDFTVVTCSFSVLKFSNGYVSGNISPSKDRVMWYDSLTKEEADSISKGLSNKEYEMLFWETMLWEEMKIKLNFSNPTK
ncbi:MAG: hypothetical protein LBV74_06265 [Tannerella sp.]|jgi:hypothetical protein|nr:hypothetical protein [Tannerella sp.]